MIAHTTQYYFSLQKKICKHLRWEFLNTTPSQNHWASSKAYKIKYSKEITCRVKDLDIYKCLVLQLSRILKSDRFIKTLHFLNVKNEL